MSSLLESKYGSSGAGFLSQSSDGKMSGAGLTKGVEQLNTIQEMYRNLPPEAQQQKINNAVAHLNDQNITGDTVSQRMDSAISHIVENSRSAVPPKKEPILGNSDKEG